MILPLDDKERAKCRLWDYFYKYFPNAQVAKAKHSYESNIKHCGEAGMTWAYEKSVGDGNQVWRHLIDGMEAADNDDIESAKYHFQCLAWRADELLERLITKMPPFEHLKSVGMYQVDDESQFANTEGVATFELGGKTYAGNPPEPETKNETNQDLPEPMSFDVWCKESGFRYIGNGTYWSEGGGCQRSREYVDDLSAQYQAAFKESNKRPTKDGFTASNVAASDI